jgi:hypothetical protein
MVLVNCYGLLRLEPKACLYRCQRLRFPGEGFPEKGFPEKGFPEKGFPEKRFWSRRVSV